MNGWADGEPSWWLSLKAQPDPRVDLADGSRLVTARAAAGADLSRLWARWRELVDTFLSARYLVKRRGKLKAIVAVARNIATLAWRLLAHPTARYHDSAPTTAGARKDVLAGARVTGGGTELHDSAA